MIARYDAREDYAGSWLRRLDALAFYDEPASTRSRPKAAPSQMLSPTLCGSRLARRIARISNRLLASAIRTSLRSSFISASRCARDRRSVLKGRSVLEDRLVVSNLCSIVSSNAEMRVVGVDTPATFAGRVAAKPVFLISHPTEGFTKVPQEGANNQ